MDISIRYTPLLIYYLWIYTTNISIRLACGYYMILYAPRLVLTYSHPFHRQIFHHFAHPKSVTRCGCLSFTRQILQNPLNSGELLIPRFSIFVGLGFDVQIGHGEVFLSQLALHQLRFLGIILQL